jgi:hypothetical protein
MNKFKFPQILFASATILLSAAYAFNLHREASYSESNNYSVLITFLFVPAIVSALSLLEYNRGNKKLFLRIGLASYLIAVFIHAIWVYLTFQLVYGTDFKLDTSFNGLVSVLPLCYIFALPLSALLLKKQNKL